MGRGLLDRYCHQVKFPSNLWEALSYERNAGQCEFAKKKKQKEIGCSNDASFPYLPFLFRTILWLSLHTIL